MLHLFLVFGAHRQLRREVGSEKEGEVEREDAGEYELGFVTAGRLGLGR